MHKRRTISQRSELIYDLHNFSINADTRELFLHPHYDAESDHAEIDHRVASTLIRNIRFLDSQNSNPIIIHMCSCGGICEYGFAIYDAIKSSSSLVYIIAYACARSMSSIILQASDVRILTSNTYMMLHEGTDGYEGTNLGLITHAKQAEKSTKQMLDIYVNQCRNGPYFKKQKISDLRIRNFIKKQIREKQEWYLNGIEAINYGLADYILGNKNCPVIADIINNS